MSGIAALWAVARSAQGHRRRLAAAVLLGVAAAGSAIGLAAVSAYLISRASQQPPVLHLMVAIVAVRAFGVARGVLRYGERLVSHDAALRVLADLRVDTYRRLQAVPPDRRPDLRSGDVAARLGADVDGLLDLWVRVLVPGLVAVTVGLATTALLAVVLPWSGALLLAGLLVVGLGAPLLSAAAARHAQRTAADARGTLAAEVVDVLAAAPELLAYGVQAARLAVDGELDAQCRAAERRTAWSAGAGAGLASLAGGATVWAVLAAGVAAVADGRLDGVLLAVVVLTPLAVLELLAGLAPASATLPGLVRSARRIRELGGSTPGEPERASALPAGPWGLRTHDLRAGWGGPDVVSGVDLDLRPGRRVAVVGGSGCGKSTLVSALSGLAPVTGGTVGLASGRDERAVATVADADLRRVVAVAEQDAHVFDSTIRENLRLARRDADDAALLEVLRRVRLDDWVASLPEGLDTFVGEHGARLSAGQRRRLTLARALLADADVLLLDEPTEHLEDMLATDLTRTLLAPDPGKAVLLVTHRRAGVDSGPVLVDEVVRLDR